MADKAIGELVAASQVGSTDLFVLQQAGTAKKLTGQILENWLLQLADGHGGIQTIAKTGTSGLVDTYTMTFADETTQTFIVTNGKAISSIQDKWAVNNSSSSVPSSWSNSVQTMTNSNRYLWHYQVITFNDSSTLDTAKSVVGVYGDTGQAWYMHIKYSAVEPTRDADMGNTPDNYIGIYSGTSQTPPTSYTSYTWYKYKGEIGLTGNGIQTVAKTGTTGLADTYTITFTDGTTSTFTLTNGSSIQNISKTGTSGLVDTYTIRLTDGTTSTFTVTNAKSITSVALTSGSHAPGTSDIYTITFNDGDTVTFSVYNGTNGTGSVSTVDGVEPVGQDVPLLKWASTSPTTTTPGVLKQRFFNTTNGSLFICTAVDTSTNPTTYTWTSAGSVSVDSALSSTSENPVQNKVIYAALQSKADSTALSGKEDTSNKRASTNGWSASPNDTRYPTEKLVKDSLDSKENTANRRSTWQNTPDNNHYPSEKLVKDALDLKADSSSLSNEVQRAQLAEASKITTPSGGSTGNVLKKTESGVEWGDGGGMSAVVAGSTVAITKYTASTTDLTAGTSSLATGELYFVYTT